MRLLFWLLPLAGLIALLMLERLGFPHKVGGTSRRQAAGCSSPSVPKSMAT
jgi:hypothetical protein